MACDEYSNGKFHRYYYNKKWLNSFGFKGNSVNTGLAILTTEHKSPRWDLNTEKLYTLRASGRILWVDVNEVCWNARLQGDGWEIVSKDYWHLQRAYCSAPYEPKPLKRKKKYNASMVYTP